MLTALLIGSIVASVAAAGVGIYQTVKNNQSIKETNELNRQVHQEDNQFNAQQALEDRTFSASQAEVSRDFSAEEAQKVREFNAEEAQKQRDYETMMSNTAIQRRAADLQAAGFNPSLAVISGSASTPGAVAATGSNPMSAQATGSRAQASPFVGMRALDYSPLSQISQGLSQMVHSARDIAFLQEFGKRNPEGLKTLAGMSKIAAQKTTGANAVDKMYRAFKATSHYSVPNYDWKFNTSRPV